MAQFEEVLDEVRLALTWASPAEIQALLEGLVEERIISEAYSKTLSLHRLTEGIAPEPVRSETACKPGSDLMNSQGSTTQRPNSPGQLSQVRKCGSSKSRDSAITDHNWTRSEPVSPMEEQCSAGSRPKLHPLYEHQVIHGNNPKLIEELRGEEVMDEHYLNNRLFSTTIAYDYQCSLGLDDEMTELLRSAESMQKSVRDNERMDEGNSEDEKEWLEQVEEAARRMAVPLWQHWDRGRRMLLPLVPCMTSVCATSENTVTESEAQCLGLNMEEETELANACRALGLCSDYFECTEAEITGVTLDTEGATDIPKGLCFSASAGLSTDLFSISGAAGNASPVEACAATDTNNNITDTLQDCLDVCWVADRTADTTEEMLSLTGDVQCGTDAGFTGDIARFFSTPKDTQTDAFSNSFYSNTDHNMTLDVLDNIENVFRAGYSTRTCGAEGITDLHEIKEDDQRMDSTWGKLALYHQIMSPLVFCSFIMSVQGYRNTQYSFTIAMKETFFLSKISRCFPFSFLYPPHQEP